MTLRALPVPDGRRLFLFLSLLLSLLLFLPPLPASAFLVRASFCFLVAALCSLVSSPYFLGRAAWPLADPPPRTRSIAQRLRVLFWAPLLQMPVLVQCHP
jgi:hypothetical protein